MGSKMTAFASFGITESDCRIIANKPQTGSHQQSNALQSDTNSQYTINDHHPNKRNKWNFHGDYHNNWEKNLIPINDKMQSDYHISMTASKHWIRTIMANHTLPEYINIIVAEFYVLPRCSGCGKYNNLWLNVGDGYIGCGRKFYALKSMGGNGCSLTHYKLNKNGSNQSHHAKAKSVAVKLGTISANGADVFDYDQPGMIFNAENDHDEDESDSDKDNDIMDDIDQKQQLLSLNELRNMLQQWGIEMNRMYLYDTTFHSNQMVLDDTFSKNAYNAFVD